LDEESPEKLTEENRHQLATYFRSIAGKYSKLTMHKGLMDAFINPPASPAECLFSKLSVNYTANLKTRVEPCVFGGSPNCAECGCSMSMGMHWLGEVKLGAGLRARHLINGSLAVGRGINRRRGTGHGLRWNAPSESSSNDLVQIEP
jgi:hypothetical protein